MNSTGEVSSSRDKPIRTRSRYALQVLQVQGRMLAPTCADRGGTVGHQDIPEGQAAEARQQS
jgi:hypothetical protein